MPSSPVERFIHHLPPSGSAGFVHADGSMSSGISVKGEIRKASSDHPVVKHLFLVCCFRSWLRNVVGGQDRFEGTIDRVFNHSDPLTVPDIAMEIQSYFSTHT
jgi:hypothetical protein